MAKRFFETFPALILEDELKDLFEFAEVTALKYNRDRTAIHVYLLCRRFMRWNLKLKSRCFLMVI